MPNSLRYIIGQTEHILYKNDVTSYWFGLGSHTTATAGGNSENGKNITAVANLHCLNSATAVAT